MTTTPDNLDLEARIQRMQSQKRAPAKPKPAITPSARSRLNRVVGGLVADCLRFYEDDLDIIEVMDEQALTAMVANFLAHRVFYLGGRSA